MSYTTRAKANTTIKTAKGQQKISTAVSEANASSSKKRKADAIDLTAADEEYAAGFANTALLGTVPTTRAAPRKKEANENGEPVEKRGRVFRKKAPHSYLERLERARTQRMFLIDRDRHMSADGKHEEEIFQIAGTTGNVYTVKVTREPKCTCPDNAKGNQCKHIIYVVVNILKAPEHLAYQLAFLSDELRQIFANAPVTPQSSDGSGTNTSSAGTRKPVEGDCPVCMMEFEDQDDVVWCRAACGNNLHRQCFEQWAATKTGEVRCVYCRTPWIGDEASIKRITGMGKMNAEGYINVATELGLSGSRDYSTYHQPWISQRFGRGHYHGY